MNRPSTTRRTPTFVVRAVVWSLFALIVATGTVVRDTSASTAPAAAVAEHRDVAAADSTVSGGGGVTIDPSSARAVLHCTGDDARVTSRSCHDRYINDPTQLLPAWRWSSQGSLYSNYGVRDTGSASFSFLASAMFAIGSWVWQLLTFGLSFALTTDLAQAAGDQINIGYKSLVSALGGAGIWWFLVLGGVVLGAKAVMRGNLSRLVSIGLTLIIPLATMHALTAAADDESSTPTGSPSWIAERGVYFTQQMGGSLSQGLGFFSPDFEMAAFGSEYAPHCDAYIAALYDQYFGFAAERRSNPDHRDALAALMAGRIEEYRRTSAAVDDAGLINQIGRSTDMSVATVSVLWQRAFYGNWVNAQFGDPEIGHRIGCHRLEDEAGIRAEEQMAIGQVADSISTFPVGALPYIAVSGDKESEARVFAWDACYWDGSAYRAAPGWNIMFSEPVTDAECHDYFDPSVGSTGDTSTAGTVAEVDPGAGTGATSEEAESELLGDLKYRDQPTLTDAVNEARLHVAGRSSGNTPSGANGNFDWLASAEENADMVRSYWGHNEGERFLMGLITMTTSLIYLWALGGIAIGAIIAQAGLVIALMLLPITLLLLAVPSSSGARHQGGSKLLKMTIGFFAAKLALVVAMTMLLQIILLLERVLASSGHGVSMYMHALIPLAALFLLRKIASALGFSNIMSASGSVGLATGAAAALSGNHALRAKTSQAFDRGADRLGLGAARDKLGALGRRHRGTAAKGAGAAALVGATGGLGLAGLAAGGLAKTGAGKAAGRALSERAGLGLMRDQLLGATDDAGNLTAAGLRQRLSSFAGIAGLAAGSRFAPIAALGNSRAAQWAAAASRRANPTTASHAQLAAAQMHERRALMAALRGKSRTERAEILENMALARTGQFRHLNQALRNPDGTTLRDGSGNAIYGWTDSDGNILAEHAEGAIPMLEPVEVFTPEMQVAELRSFMDEMGLREGQAVNSIYGVGAVIRPTRGGIVQGKTFEHTVRLSRNGLNYVADHLKVAPAGLTDDGVAHYYRELEVALGLVDTETGETVDYLATHGINVDAAEGRAELEAHLAGRPSRLDHIVPLTLDATTLAGITARSFEVSRRSSGVFADMGREATRLRDEAVAATKQAALAAQAEANRAALRFEALRGELLDTLTKQTAVERKIEITADPAKLDSLAVQLDEFRGRTDQLLDELCTQAEAVHTNATSTELEAHTLDVQFDMMLAAKNKRSIDAIAESHDDWMKKEHGPRTAEQQRQLDLAIAQLRDASAATEKEARAAINEMSRHVQTWFRSAGRHADQASAKHGHIRLSLDAHDDADRKTDARTWSGGPELATATSILDANRT